MNEYLEIKSSMSLFESESINKIINEIFLIYINLQNKERKKEKASLRRVRSRISRIIGWRKRERSAKESGSFRDFSFLPRYSWILVSTRNVDERKLELHVEESGSLVFETDRVDEFPE